MRSAKYIGLFAACGFILSFVAGLFSHSSILSILIKALIFALVFGLLGFGISFVYNKFLSDGSGGDFQGDYTAEPSAAPASASSLGHNVDIMIQDEELRPSESENHFVVGENHQMLNDSDVRNSQTVVKEPQSSSQGFVPLRNFETVKNFSGTEAVIPAEAVSAAPANNSSDTVVKPAAAAPVAFDSLGGGEGIDTLPDMENFVFSEASESDGGDSDNESEAEFIASVGGGKKNDAPAEVQDAALMAKAISSVLSNENS